MYNILSQKLKFSSPFQSIEPLESAYPDALSAICGLMVLSRLLSGVGQSRAFDSHISQLKEPFYLTDDKSARLALIEPPKMPSPLSPSAVHLLRATKKEEPHLQEFDWLFSFSEVSCRRNIFRHLSWRCYAKIMRHPNFHKGGKLANVNEC